MQKWEYLIVTVNNGKIDSVGEENPEKAGFKNTGTEQGFIEDLGEEGWELVTIVATHQVDRNKLYFKRPKAEEKPKSSGYRHLSRRGV